MDADEEIRARVPADVEAADPLVLGLTPSAWTLAAWVWVALLGIVLAAVDFAVRRLPDPLTAAAAAGCLLLLSAGAFAEGTHAALVRAVLCALLLGGAYLALVLSPRGSLGRGDAQLALSIGLCLGWLSITAVAVGTAATIVTAGASVLVLLLTGRIRPSDRVPFGPFILLGALIAVIVLR